MTRLGHLSLSLLATCLISGCNSGRAAQCPAAEVGEAEAIAIAIKRSEEQIDGQYRIGQSAYLSDHAIDPGSCCSASREQHVVSGKEVWQVVIETPVRDGTATLLVNLDLCGEEVDATSMLTRETVRK